MTLDYYLVVSLPVVTSYMLPEMNVAGKQSPVRHTLQYNHLSRSLLSRVVEILAHLVAAVENSLMSILKLAISLCS